LAPRMKPRRFAQVLALLGAAGLTACGDPSVEAHSREIAGADPETGRSLIQAYGCGTCHTIEGVRGARGRVGPALADGAGQHLLAGFLPNTPEYLVAWLRDPVALSPKTGMPAQGLSDSEARHIASYLYSLGAKPPVYPPDPLLPIRSESDRATGLEDPVASRRDTTPRTHRRTPQDLDSATP
jgi:cytochrome c2